MASRLGKRPIGEAVSRWESEETVAVEGHALEHCMSSTFKSHSQFVCWVFLLAEPPLSQGSTRPRKFFHLSSAFQLRKNKSLAHHVQHRPIICCSCGEPRMRGRRHRRQSSDSLGLTKLRRSPIVMSAVGRYPANSGTQREKRSKLCENHPPSKAVPLSVCLECLSNMCFLLCAQRGYR